MAEVKFIKVSLSDSHIQILYQLLTDRVHFISHESLPSYEEHSLFCKSDPYLHWFLVKSDDAFIGSFYISSENTIGINLIDIDFKNIISEIIAYIRENFQPLPPIMSQRGSKFSINVPITNNQLIESLIDVGGKRIQTTFII